MIIPFNLFDILVVNQLEALRITREA